MGYLNKSTVTVDAILTKKGRELLAKGRSAFDITQFAVADDEIDYGLYNPAHPLGTEYYGSAIENMPIVEASPDETQNLRYKLVTLPRTTTTTIPRITNVPQSIILTVGQPQAFPINPLTSDATYNNLPFGYTAILYNGNAATISTNGLPSTATATVPVFIGDVVSENAVVVKGTTFTIAPTAVTTVTKTQLVIIGNQTGASVSIPVTINPATSV